MTKIQINQNAIVVWILLKEYDYQLNLSFYQKECCTCETC